MEFNSKFEAYVYSLILIFAACITMTMYTQIFNATSWEAFFIGAIFGSILGYSLPFPVKITPILPKD